MELEIEDKLQEIYKNLIIEVKFKDFRKYEINVRINNEGISILENVSSTGLKLPPKLKEVLKQLRDKGE